MVADIVAVTPAGVLLLSGSGLRVGAWGEVESLADPASVRVLATWRDAALGQVRLAGSGRSAVTLAGERVDFG